MKKIKFFALSFLAFFGLASLNAQDVKQTTKVTKTEITGEDLLGLKSGADPKKAEKKKAGYSRKEGRPVVFIIGDSTTKNGKDNGSNGQWGWGHFFSDYIDTTKFSVENHALGGRSSRTFITEGLWNNVLEAVQPGDFVIMSFGHNDSGSFNMGRARASIKGNGDNDTTVVMELTGKTETVHSFGWYMRKYAQDTKAKKATPILMSHIPRNMYTNKDSVNVIRNSDSYGAWTKEAAKMEKVIYIDLNQILADKYDFLGKTIVPSLFYGDHTHTSLAGAVLNAKTVAESVRNYKGRKAGNLKNLQKAIIIKNR